MTRSKPWSSKVPEDRMLPIGPPEALDRAKAALGPFAELHVSDLVCLCEPCAEARIYRLVRHCNALRFLADGAPRAGHVTENLNDVAQLARQLASKLSLLDDYSRDWLSSWRQSAPGEPDTRLLQVQAKSQELPSPSFISDSDGSLVTQLNALSTYVNLRADRFEAMRTFSPFPLNDVGGNTNMVTQLYGTQTEKLVYGAYHIFEDFKPDSARKTENGAFHRFVVDIHIFATGSETGQTNLFEFVKRTLGPEGALRPPKVARSNPSQE